MLTYNTMRFGTDYFSLAAKQAMLISKNPLNYNRLHTHIKNFAFDYYQPTGSKIRFLHRVVHDDTDVVRYFYARVSERLCKYEDFANYDFATLMEKANTIDEMLAIENFAAYAGYDFYPIILLEGDDADPPKVKMSAVFEQREETLDKEYESIHLGDASTVKKLLAIDSPPVTITGNGEHSWHAYYMDESGNWSDKIIPSKLSDLVGKKVKQIKTVENFHVDAVNSANAVERGNWYYTYAKDPNDIVFGDTADVYSILKNYYLPLKYCAVIVKHEALDGAKIQAFARFDPTVYSINNREIGTGTGAAQTITLPTAKFFNPDSLKLFVNGSRFYDFNFNANDNSITLTAPSGAAITLTCTYNYQGENWIQLTADKIQHDFSDGLFTTRYYCANVKDYGDNVVVSAVRLHFVRSDNGTVPHVHSFTAGWSV